MTIEYNAQTLATAACEVLNVHDPVAYSAGIDAAYVAETHFELELIEQGFMSPNDAIESIEFGSDDKTNDRTVIAILGFGTNLIVNTRTGAVIVSK